MARIHKASGEFGVYMRRTSSYVAPPTVSGGNETVTLQSEIEEAFRKVFRWIGEDPDRDGLRETPGRLARAYQEYFSGYGQDPERILAKTFEETDGYDEMIVLRGVPFESHCEHHIAPIIGNQVLKPQGVGVVIKAAHHCMSSRGVRMHGTDLVTSRMLGCFRDNPMTRQELMSMVHRSVDE